MSSPTNPFDIPEFRDELNETLARHLEPVNNLLTEHSQAIHEQSLTLQSHDRDIHRAKGIIAILTLGWTTLIAWWRAKHSS